ncbi:hypothetical protein [Nocardioides sp. AX2bis]|uniref:hypothetical protein n=1 Tax=Nocardioides sp. AX2bis TaxID=2653157 RepID=UPI0012EF5022|nr:hypothetical protein [Nocardioides sp. AX2bis]VXC00136.1 conserved hypothetical protein [Nocardioides sp. AX2bis]
MTTRSAAAARRRGVVAGVLGLAVLGTATVVGWDALRGSSVLPGSAQCVAVVDGHEVGLEAEQAENAALITAISVRRGMPARAASIALATAYQESDLYNVEFGDRDSLGLFQQRPSQGWGTEEQVLDPVYSTNAFYDALAEVDGYEGLEITVAAQEVQRSGFPDAYADHELDARALASALTGNSRASFTCETADDAEPASTELTGVGLTPRAETVRQELLAVFGDGLALGGYAPEGVSTGHMEGSAHYSGRAVDVFVRPINEDNKTRGWAMAHYLVAQADRLDVDTVIFDAQIWTTRRSDEGWRDYDVDTSDVDQATAAVLEHRDHVHVDVAE